MVCMYVCTYVCTHVCMYIRYIYVCTYVCTYVYIFVRAYVCICNMCNVYNIYNAFIFNIHLHREKNNYTIYNKFYFYNTLSLCIQEMYELSNLSYFKPCLLFYLFIITSFHLDIRRSDATHAHILQRPVFRGNLPIDIVCHRISFLCFDSKYLRDLIWRVTFLKDRLECAYTVPSHLL